MVPEHLTGRVGFESGSSQEIVAKLASEVETTSVYRR